MVRHEGRCTGAAAPASRQAPASPWRRTGGLQRGLHAAWLEDAPGQRNVFGHHNRLEAAAAAAAAPCIRPHARRQVLLRSAPAPKQPAAVCRARKAASAASRLQLQRRGSTGNAAAAGSPTHTTLLYRRGCSPLGAPPGRPAASSARSGRHRSCRTPRSNGRGGSVGARRQT